MQMSRLSLTVGLCVMLCGVPAREAAADSLFADNTKNAQILEEAALTNYLLLGQFFGTSNGNTLTIMDGTFSAFGWSFNLSGNYQGMSANLAFVGNYDSTSGSGSFTSNGVVGSSSLDGSGTWTWGDVGGDEEDLTFAASQTLATIIPPEPEWDYDTAPGEHKTYKKFGEFEGEDLIMDTANLNLTYFGQVTPFGGGHEFSVYQRPKPNLIIEPAIATETASLSYADLTAVESYPSNSVSGSVSTVPEPCSVLLWSTGLTGFSLLRWVQRKRDFLEMYLRGRRFAR